MRHVRPCERTLSVINRAAQAWSKLALGKEKLSSAISDSPPAKLGDITAAGDGSTPIAVITVSASRRSAGWQVASSDFGMPSRAEDSASSGELRSS